MEFVTNARPSRPPSSPTARPWAVDSDELRLDVGGSLFSTCLAYPAKFPEHISKAPEVNFSAANIKRVETYCRILNFGAVQRSRLDSKGPK